MSISLNHIERGTLVRRILFFLVLIFLTFGNLFTLFRGLNSPHAMDQAQIAREIARGNGPTTKIIRPLDYHLVKEHQDRVIPFDAYEDTYHSLLNPLLNAAVLKMIGADDSERWKMSEKQLVYDLDRVIAAVSTLCFLIAIGVSYLLISKIFDGKIAGVTAILMLFSQTFWDYSLSGLPQMLMLLLFSCALYFAYRAVENSSEGRIPFTPAVIAGVFFTLLSMTHYLTVWIALGYIIFAAIAFKPRGVIGISILGVLIVPSIFIIIRNYGITGTPFGAAFFNLYNGIGGDSEDFAMRSTVPPDLLNRGFFSTILRSALLQTTDLIAFLAGIFIAPLFFISLMHPFKRTAIARFRWAILLMFVSSAFGLAIYGVSSESLDPNQTHLLFAPIMTAYGLAFISILWSKLPVVATVPMMRNLHHIVIVMLCALPLILSLPSDVRLGMKRKDRGGIPHWPPYFAPALNLGLKEWLTESQICFSDQPWAVAWYADRVSIWLPPEKADFVALESIATELDTPVAGILISPSSHGSGSPTEIARNYKDFTPFVLDGRVFLATYPPGIAIYQQNQNIKEIANRYPYRASLLGMDMIYYSDRALVTSEDAN